MALVTGAALLARVAELDGSPRDQLAIACGYVTPKGKPAYTLFYEALMQAKGLALAPAASTRKPGRGKPPSYEATIAKTGTLPVGGVYTSEAGWAAGDKVRITVDGMRLILERIAAPEAASSAAEAPAEPVASVGAAVPAAGAPAAAGAF
jgi:hypothetical protein